MRRPCPRVSLRALFLPAGPRNARRSGGTRTCRRPEILGQSPTCSFRRKADRSSSVGPFGLVADSRRASWIAAGAALLMIAEHVAGKAVRDALFLSTFGIHALPTMFIVAAVVSIAIVPMLSRVLASRGP